MKEVKFLPFTEKMKRKLTFFFGKYQKYFSSCVENISNQLRTFEIPDIFNTFDEIYLVSTSKK